MQKSLTAIIPMLESCSSEELTYHRHQNTANEYTGVSFRYATGGHLDLFGYWAEFLQGLKLFWLRC